MHKNKKVLIPPSPEERDILKTTSTNKNSGYLGEKPKIEDSTSLNSGLDDKKDSKDFDEDDLTSLVEGTSTRPNQLHIGYYAYVKKPDMKRFTTSLCSARFEAKETSFYAIKKYKEGFLYEIHEGGNGIGCISSVIKLLKKGEKACINTASGTTVVEDRSPDGLYMTLITEEDDFVSDSPGIEFKDKMAKAFKKGVGIFIAGIVVALIGLLSLMAASTFKYVVYNTEKVTKVPAVMQTPISQIKEIKALQGDRSKYVDQIIFEAGKWEVKTKDVEKNEESDSNNKIPLPPGVEGAEAEEMNKDIMDVYNQSSSGDADTKDLNDMAKGG